MGTDAAEIIFIIQSDIIIILSNLVASTLLAIRRFTA